MATLVWLNTACNCSDEQLGNVKDIHKSDCAHCQWFHKSLLTSWNCYLTLIKKIVNALLSLFLTAYHYSHRYQSQCHRRLQNLNVHYFEWHWMSSLDICQPQTWSHQDSQALGILLGLLHLNFNQVLWHEETVCPVYLPLFHSQYASHGHLLEEWF